MVEAVAAFARHVRGEMDKVIVGQDALKTECLVVLLCEGHGLIEGVPGLAKTLTVKALARVLQLDFRRVQCTADLMPADIVGTSVAHLASGTFQFRGGPVFTHLLLVDEVNRMPPRTQAALLECMEERQVTADGVRHDLSPFFSVFATQNPVEFEGTYPLPEAQLDRFLLKILVPYPEAAEEVRLLENVQRGFDARHLDAMQLQPIDKQMLLDARRDVRGVKVQDALLGYVSTLVRRTRDWPAVSLGASPRASVSLLVCAKAMAALDGRDYIVPDDVQQAAVPVLRHRIMLRPEADLEGLTADQVLRDVIRAVDVPR